MLVSRLLKLHATAFHTMVKYAVFALAQFNPDLITFAGCQGLTFSFY